MKKCKVCNKQFEKNKSYSNAQWQRAMYCSRQCSGADKRNRKEIICPVCHTAFSVYISSSHKFCSRACAYIGRKSGTTNQLRTNKSIGLATSNRQWYIQEHRESRICEYCKEQFTVQKSSKKRFCSRHCKDRWWAEHRLIPVTCPQCGKQFMRTEKSKTRNKKKFCSALCYYGYMKREHNHNWKGGGEFDYGPDWFDIRRAILKRDKVCKDCGGKPIDVHHIISARSFGKDFEKMNDPSNLKALCKRCHRKYQKREYTYTTVAPALSGVH